MERPGFTADEHLEYLDRAYWKEIEGEASHDGLFRKFRIPIEEAKETTRYWRIEFKNKGIRWL